MVSFNNAGRYFGCSYRDKVGVIILCGGEGKRLAPLTKNRCKPTVSFGGRYKLIDIPISHAITSGFSKIFVIGQYLTYTLQQHLFKTYFYHGVVQDQIHLLVPEERNGEKIWYQGTADAIRQNLLYLEDVDVEYFLILSGDQLYNINFQKMVDYAQSTNASMVIAAQPIPEKDATRMGVMLFDDEYSLKDFYEKPQSPAVLDKFKSQSTCGRKKQKFGDKGFFWGSMGIYLFRKEELVHLLKNDNREDFGKHLIQTQMQKGDVKVFVYDGYWTDIGTIESYYEANLSLTRLPLNPDEGLSCYRDAGKIFSKNHHLPGAMISNSLISDSLLCEGAIINSSKISSSVLGIRSVIGQNTVIQDSVLIGNSGYSFKNSRKVGIGQDCLIQKAIIDENCSIGNGVILTNSQELLNYESPDGKVTVRDGIIIIPSGTEIPDNYVF
ncbi:sugar phosphate nucleotidyltransferase [Chlamydiifrater volucris]|uniref:sugar phosphate nucleotidyltransferase n=1 Tax=Chlamydiifrater volucris TaxID=2681470 RepID=UPI001BCFB454|nr:sugar phosphate nucleotidyltransferase [Chlamydiifrater volucris]